MVLNVCIAYFIPVRSKYIYYIHNWRLHIYIYINKTNMYLSQSF